jgi:MFS family permease
MAIKGLGLSINENFPALRHRNFRLFWIGQCFSLIGTWMQNIGQSWLVLELTHSALKLSIITMMQFLPMLLFSLAFGTLIDKFPKKNVLIFTQTAMMVLALILATLTYFKVIEYWHIVILALALGIVNTLDMPTRQAYMSEIVERKDIMNAIALNSSIFNLARIIGPAIAGLMIGLWGIAICFYLNALSFLAVIGGLFMIDAVGKPVVKMSTNFFKSVSEEALNGLKYVNSKDELKRPLIFLAFIAILVMNYGVVIPIFAKQTLGMDATGYAFLMAIMGTGSFSGAMIVAIKSNLGPQTKFQLAGALGSSVFLLLLGVQNNLILISIFLFGLGFSASVFISMINSVLQINASEMMRGRVMSIYTLVFVGFSPFGSLISGILMEYFQAPGCMVITGILGLLITMVFIYQHNNPKKTMVSEVLS